MQTITAVGKKILDTMPLPIAVAWKRVINGANSSEQVRQCWSLLEVYLRYSSGILLAGYLRDDPDPSVEQCLEQLERNMSLGHYCMLIRAILKTVHGKEHFFSHIAEWYFTENGKPTEEVKLLEELIHARNKDSHGAVATEAVLQEEGKVDDFKRRLESLLHSSKWLMGYTLFRCANINTKSRFRQSGYVFRYHGTDRNPVCEKEHKWQCISDGGYILEPRRMYVSNPSGDAFLEVKPFVEYLLVERQPSLFLWLSVPKGSQIRSRCESLVSVERKIEPMIEDSQVSWRKWLEHRKQLTPIIQNALVEDFVCREFNEIGSILGGQYRIESRLGNGGMATVYAASDILTNQMIALKVLHIQQADTTVRERMIAEARLMKSLEHSNILSIHSIRTLEDKRVAISMPIMEGTLKDLLSNNEYDVELVEEWAVKLLSAINYLHTQSSPIIHRDIKPSNILYDQTGQIFLADFGVAWQNSEDSGLTRTGEQLGSLPYMAKELTYGDKANPATDRYALGVTLYELLMGTPRIDRTRLNNTEFHQFVAQLLDPNPEVRLQAQWGVGIQIEEAETEMAPPIESESKWSTFSKRVVSQFKSSLSKVDQSTEHSEESVVTAEPIEMLEEDVYNTLLQWVLNSVIEEHGLDLAAHHAMPRVESTIRRSMAQRETPDLISIDLPYLAYDAQNGVDIHFSGQMSIQEIQQAHLHSLPKVDLSIEDKQEALTAWVVNTFLEQNGVDISNRPDKMGRVNREVEQSISGFDAEQGVELKLPYLAYDVQNMKDLHFHEILSASDLRTLFAEYHEQKNTFDVEAALEQVNQLFHARKMDELIEELKRSELANVPRCNTIRGYLHLWQCSSIERNVEEAERLLTLAADEDPMAQYWLAKIYLDGMGGIAKDPEKGISLIRRAVEGGYGPALKRLEVEYRKREDIEMAEQLARQFVDLMNTGEYDDQAEYINAMGGSYRNGFGVEQDDERAFVLFQKAAELGSPYAQYLMGLCYEVGTGVEPDDEKMFSWYLRAAEQGDADAQWNIGFYYELGFGVEDDEKKAFQWYMRAAEQGNLTAQNSIGDCYANGVGVEIDGKQAFHYQNMAARDGHIDALFKLGTYYQAGLGVTMDKAMAVHYYHKAVDAEHRQAHVRLANCYIEGIGVERDQHYGFQLYRTVVTELDYSLAYYDFAQCFEYGIGISQNVEEARYWYQKGAEEGYQDCIDALSSLGHQNEPKIVRIDRKWIKDHCQALRKEGITQTDCLFCDDTVSVNNYLNHYDKQHKGESLVEFELDGETYFGSADVDVDVLKQAYNGDADVQFLIGHMFHTGLGVSQNPDMAFKWYSRSADQDNALGQWGLGHCYQGGIGVEQNIYTAFQFFVDSAEQGDLDAQVEVGSCFENGLGVQSDEETAFEWYMKAAAQENARGQYHVGLSYQLGIGTEQDEQESVKWFMDAAEQGYSKAQWELGRAYEFGIGTLVSDFQAFKWYKESAENGYPPAQSSLGRCFETGVGTNENPTRAFEWYERASINDDAAGEWHLGRCYNLGIGVDEDEEYAVQLFTFAAQQGFVLAYRSLGECYEYGWGVAKDLEEALTWYKMARDEGIDVDEHIERIKSQKPRGFFSTLFDL